MTLRSSFRSTPAATDSDPFRARRSFPHSLSLLGLALVASLSLGACATAPEPAPSVPPPRAVSIIHWQDQATALAGALTQDLRRTYAQNPLPMDAASGPSAGQPMMPPSVCVSLPGNGPTSSFEDAFSTLFSNGLTQAGAQVQLDLNQCDYLIGLTFQSVPFSEPLDEQTPQFSRQEVMVEASAITPQGTTVSAHSVIFSAPPLDVLLYNPPMPMPMVQAQAPVPASAPDTGLRTFKVTP